MAEFPHNIKIGLAQFIYFLLHPDVALFLSCWLSQFSKTKLGRDGTTSGCNSNKNLIGPILFFQFEFKTKYLGFIVLILVHTYWSFQTTCTLFVYHQNEFLSHNHHRSFSLIFRLLITYPALEVRNEDFDKS